MDNVKGLTYPEIDEAARDYALKRLDFVTQGEITNTCAEVFDSCDISQAFRAGISYALEQIEKNKS